MICSNVGEHPAFLLQFVNDRGNGLAAIFLAAVLLAVGNDGHQHAVVVSHCLPDAVDAEADCIIQGSAGSGVILVWPEVVDFLDGDLVSQKPDIPGFERNDAYQLFLIGELVLRPAYCLQCLVQTVQSLTLDTTHATTLVQNNQVEYFCFHTNHLLRLTCSDNR